MRNLDFIYPTLNCSSLFMNGSVIKYFILITTICFAQYKVQAQSPFWSKAHKTTNDTKISAYLSFELNIVLLQNTLAQKENIVISIPDPNGIEQKFILFPNHLLAPALQNKFPQIKTFDGHQLNNPNITVKASYTTHGFNAMIYNGDHTYIIAPHKDNNNYKAFYKKNYISNRQKTCGVNTDQQLITDELIAIIPSPLEPQLQHGAQRKIYRLALSCTGEY